MIDTTPTRIPVDMIPIEDVDRIEIVPGGGTVLYGSGTMGRRDKYHHQKEQKEILRRRL